MRTFLKKFSSKEKIFAVLLILFYFIITVILYNEGMHTANDSIGYLDGHIFRPPVYPLIIKICKLIGESYYIQLLLLFQILAGIYSVYLFSNFLRKTFSLNHWFSFVFSIVLLSPYLSLSKYNKYFQLLLLLFILTYFFKGILFSDLFKKTFSLNYLVAFCFASVFFLPYQITSIFIGNFLLSESFAYPLFLLTFMFLCEGIIDKNEKKVIIALVFNFFWFSQEDNFSLCIWSFYLH